MGKVDQQANGYDVASGDHGDDDPYIVFGYGSLIFRVCFFHPFHVPSCTDC